MLAWGTLYSSIVYGFAMLYHYPSQLAGLKCLAGIGADNVGCLPHAWVPVLITGFSALALDLLQVFFVAADSAFFLILSDAIATPLTTLVFSLHFIVGKFAAPIGWTTVGAIALTMLGTLVYKELWHNQK